MFNQNQHKIKPLLNEILLYNDDIDDHPEEPIFYYQRATALSKLGELTKDTSRLDKALEDYNLAVKFAPGNPLYLVDRAKLYVNLAATSDVEKSKLYLNLANSDIKVAKGLPSDGTEKIYIRNTIGSVLTEIDNISIKNNPAETNNFSCTKLNY